MNLLVKFSRFGNLGFCSHLDLLRTTQRTMRRAEMPMRYSEGFNPHPILTFAQALGVGLKTKGDYFAVGLEKDVDPEVFLARFNAHAPEGLVATAARAMDEHEKSPMAQVAAALYRVAVKADNLAALHEGIRKLLQMPVLLRITTDRTKDIRPLILQAECDREGALFLVSCGNENLSHKTLAESLSEICGIPGDDIKIFRENLLTKIEEDAYAPLENVRASSGGR
jgi:radical SAM-linked protein